jgi:hypothetical protein
MSFRDDGNPQYFEGAREALLQVAQGQLPADAPSLATTMNQVIDAIHAAELRAQAAEERWHREQGEPALSERDLLAAAARDDEIAGLEPVEADPAEMERLCREQPQREGDAASAKELMEMQEWGPSIAPVNEP